MVSEQSGHLQLFIVKLASVLDAETKISGIYSGLTVYITLAGNDKLEGKYSRWGVIFKQKYRGGGFFGKPSSKSMQTYNLGMQCDYQK